VTDPKNEGLPDLSPREWTVVAPLVALALFMGVASPYFTRFIEPSVDRLVIQLQQRTRASTPTTALVVGSAPAGERP
jgi:NADH:ubiquinone oxidoreductase subunit 4 (subunit M)